MTREEVIDIVEQEIKGLSTNFVADDYDNAATEASQEIGWAFPITDDFKILWMKRRVKRHLLFMLYTESAHKFKVKQYSLDQRFKHYGQIIEKMDRDFVKIQDDRPEMFSTSESYKMFGTVTGTGTQYDVVGKDVTDYTNYGLLGDE